MFKISEIKSIELLKESFPSILYKYRNWSNPLHKTILTNQELFLAAPDSFPDKNDCHFPIDWDFSFSFFKPILEAIFRGKKSLTSINNFNYEIIKEYYNHLGTKNKQFDFINNYYRLMNHHLGVLSMTTRNNSLEIWKSAYASDFDGFCVGIDFKQHLQMLSDNHIGWGIVKYVPYDYPKLKYVDINTHSLEEVLELYMKNITTKYIDFGFEQEFRLVKFSFANKNLKNYWENLTDDDRKLITPKECFKTIIFGFKMLESEINDILHICDQQELKVDFFKASPTDKGSVDIEPFNSNP